MGKENNAHIADKEFDKIMSGEELVDCGFRQDSKGFLIGTTFTYGVYFPIRTYNIVRIDTTQQK